MGVIISLANLKGGIGKTTSTTALGHALANRGHKVLLVDQDTQANCTRTILGFEAETNTLYDFYSGGLSIQECIYRTPYDGLSLIPNIPATGNLEIEMFQDIQQSSLMLRRCLRDYAKSHYDYTLIDTSPSLGLFVTQALIASDYVIIPIEAGSRMSIDGLDSALIRIDGLRERINPDLQVMRFLVNKVDMRTTISKLSVEKIRKRFGDDKVFATSIPNNVDVKKSEEACQTVIRFAPRSPAAKHFKALAEEVEQFVQENS
ncbi:MAG: ParA family protein [Desulfuromonas thiophila]|jgi:cellulose biosynthesis protein BcsQ|nr:ParA family protein [Desulfuromonas thiophila]